MRKHAQVIKMKQKEIGKIYVSREVVDRAKGSFSSTSAAKTPQAEDTICIKKKRNNGTEKTITLVVRQIKDAEQRKELEKTAKKVLDYFGDEEDCDDDDLDQCGGLLY